jgi:hypothetical protein
MFYAGDYQFNVRICNVFDPSFNITFNVERCHHLNYFSRDLSSPGERVVVVKDVPDPGNGKLYQIEGGDSLTFPMYFEDESLTLSVSGDLNQLPNNYTISIGTTAKCYPSGGMKLIDGTSAGTGQDPPPENGVPGQTYYKGGAWSIPPSDTGWKLTIKKFGPDPEDDDVIIGPDPPPAP